LILQDLADNDVTFPLIGTPEILEILVEAQNDTSNVFSHYATNILTLIIKEYPEYEKVLGD